MAQWAEVNISQEDKKFLEWKRKTEKGIIEINWGATLKKGNREKLKSKGYILKIKKKEKERISINFTLKTRQRNNKKSKKIKYIKESEKKWARGKRLK